MKVIRVGKEEVKLFLFAFDMILYVENPKDMIKLLGLNNEFSTVLDTKSTYKYSEKTNKQGNPAISYSMDDFQDIMLNDIRQRDKYSITTHV